MSTARIGILRGSNLSPAAEPGKALYLVGRLDHEAQIFRT